MRKAKSLKEKEAEEEAKNRIEVKKHLRRAIIASIWLFFGFVCIYFIQNKVVKLGKKRY